MTAQSSSQGTQRRAANVEAAQPALVASVEAGGTKFVCAISTGPDDVRATTSFATTSPEESLGQAVAFIQGHRRTGLDVSAVGVACFGPLDLREESPTYGHITSTPKPGWKDTDVVAAFTHALGVPVGFDTDVNGAALAESQWGAGRGLDPVVYVTVGTGIGGGAMVDGGLLHGLMHPEMGHVPVRRHPDDPFEGVCPYHGDCLEGLASGPAIEARWHRSARDLGPERDNAVALESWYLAQLASTLAYVLSPELIIFGGGVLKLPGLLAAIRAETATLLNGYLGTAAVREHIDRYIVAPELGDRAGVLGGIALAQRVVHGPGRSQMRHVPVKDP
jgi:fructokinase